MTALSDIFGARLDRVQAVIDPPGCAVCRTWHGHVLSYDDPVTGAMVPDRPERCPLCGRHVPIIHWIHLEGVEPGAI